MKKRFLTIMLCFAMVFSMLPISPSYASSELSVNICENGNPVDSVSLPQNEKVQLTVVSDEMELTQCQWQIQVNENLWVNIAGAEDESLDLSYAMVASLLQNDAVEIRCVAVSGGQNAVSEPVTVTVDYSQQTDFAGQNTYAPSNDDAASVSVDADVPEENTTWSLRSTTYDLSNDEEAADEPVAPLDDTPSTYNIVINYLFENNEIAADPYTANLAAGSDFSTTVTFPTVQGYLPYVNDVLQTSIELNYTAIDQDDTINVVYKPTNVNYTVIHYQQNVNDDNYTVAETETKQGLTASTVPDVAKNYEGFYALLYETPAIAADGSTIVEIYYDRYYYLMNFDLDGGYGVEPTYARYGAPIVYQSRPIREGYDFTGWELNGEPIKEENMPTTMPAENRTYKAIWQPSNTAKVTVVFWGENANDEEYSYIKSAKINAKPETEFTYNPDGSLACGQEEHIHDASCGYACDQTEHTHDKDCYTLVCTQEVHTHSASCYTCGLKSHTHDISCYAGVGSASYAGFGAPSNPTNGYVAREALSIDGKVIYINGTWYKYTGSTSTGNVASTTCGETEGVHNHTDTCLGCGKTEHKHTDYTGSCYKLTCTKTEHTHSDACQYNCGKTAHKHDEGCYMSDPGLDSGLWKFVKSDTVTVAADGSSIVNVYYDRIEKTLTFNYNYNNRNNYQSSETITAKWGSNIAEQYKKIAANAGSTFWSAEWGGSGPYTNYFGVMPQNSATYYNRGTTGSEGTMTYWGQDLDGNYTVKLFEVTGVGGYRVTVEDRYEFEGFTYDHGTSTGSSCNGAKFYYTRNSYTLTFNDGYSDVKSESVKYEAPLSSYSGFVPSVPSAYEPGSVVFGGWYLNPECTGEKYELEKHNMPAENILLYAKWEPVSHYVRFYLDKNAYEDDQELSTHPIQTVLHGNKLNPEPSNPVNGSYEFVGWFYMENGVEKAFDFANMPVTKDLKVYGKWSSNVLKQYTILYKIQDTDTKIAMPTLGSGLAGVTKTFEAKGGTELYADYQEGYFPVVKSHSMTLDINATEENDTNVYTFWYVQKDAVPYTVKYLNKDTGEPVADEITVSDNRKAVVTETFKPVSGMMPDAYQKRLIVSVADDAVNEIIFYYSEDTTHAYYKITHYTENLATDAQGNPTWTEYASSQIVGDIGTTYGADPLTISGFTYDGNVEGTVASGELTADGLELKLYYTRNSYPYQVRYLEQGTGKQLADPKNGTGKYGQVVSESAIEIEDYEAVDPKSQTLSIKIESDAEAKLNIISFYYKEKEVTIKYEVVGPQGETNFGSVSPTSETLKVLSGDAKGSTATANERYRFVGWYSDSSCGILLSTDAKYTPSKVDKKNVAATYYAKFEYDVADLTITKTGTQSIDENQAFIFRIQGKDSRTSGLDMKVVIKGNGIVTVKDLLIGEYTVTEETEWSWRYTPEKTSKTITLSAIEENNVPFTNSRGTGANNWKWLNGASYVENKFSKVDVVAGE
ncbi:MAG: InlB B-repeat-containing protein [Anaerovoracaceae bacterium]